MNKQDLTEDEIDKLLQSNTEEGKKLRREIREQAKKARRITYPDEQN